METFAHVRAADVWHLTILAKDGSDVLRTSDMPPTINQSVNNQRSVIVPGTCVEEPMDNDSVEHGYHVEPSKDSAVYRQRVLGRTCVDNSSVVLRSLRDPSQSEAAQHQKWRQLMRGSGLRDPDSKWTTRGLCLLVDEWRAYSSAMDQLSAAYHTTNSDPTADPLLHQPQPMCSPTRPFMGHTGHLVVPFDRFEDGCAFGNFATVSGLALEVDPGVRWRRWEPFLREVAFLCGQQLRLLTTKAHRRSS